MAVETLDLLDPIKKYTIADGYTNLILDLEKSDGVWIKNKLNDDTYLDFFSFFASSPLGFNHPKMVEDQDFLKHLQMAALHKVSNSDFYTEEFSSFIDIFANYVAPSSYEHFFFISGGALAVENALKASFDWKVRKNFSKGRNKEFGSQVIHFKESFHGRSGYTLSLTNTADPRKYQYYPLFDWPRIDNPKIVFPLEKHLDAVMAAEQESITQINQAIERNPDDVAALILEPIQGEGGDNHFRHEFLMELRKITSEHDIMLIYDEVQTGIGLTGKMWALEHFPGAEPDIVSFGKKTQVCGIMANNRIDDVENNVFKESSRINSTWGGNLVDMVRSRKYMEIIREDKLIDQVKRVGDYLEKYMMEVSESFEMVSNIRNKGLFAAFDLPTTKLRDDLKADLFKNKLIMLGCGTQSMRFRPPLIVEETHIDQMGEILQSSLKKLQ